MSIRPGMTRHSLPGTVRRRPRRGPVRRAGPPAGVRVEAGQVGPQLAGGASPAPVEAGAPGRRAVHPSCVHIPFVYGRVTAPAPRGPPCPEKKAPRIRENNSDTGHGGIVQPLSGIPVMDREEPSPALTASVTPPCYDLNQNQAGGCASHGLCILTEGHLSRLLLPLGANLIGARRTALCGQPGTPTGPVSASDCLCSEPKESECQERHSELVEEKPFVL